MIMDVLYGSLLALLVVIGAALYLRRLRAQRISEVDGITDAMIQQIEEQGRIELDVPEPLDLDHIREEESRFWDEEPWDEPEEL
jgi:hypothetical protein